MYNGIGLKTARGSGTNGYVTTNRSSVSNPDYVRERNRHLAPRSVRTMDARAMAPDPGVLDHQRKRQIEVQLCEMRDRLEDQGVPDAEIDRRVARARESLRERQNGGTRMHLASPWKSCQRRRHGCGIHAKERKAEGRVRVREDHVDGESFDAEAQQRRRVEDGLRWSATERSKGEERG